jgi:putative tRNA adenosine deaminase-associated protein
LRLLSGRKDVSYFAAVLARGTAGWTGQELDLDGAEDVDEVAELIRDVSDSARTALLFVEEDDEYVAIVRVDRDADEPRVFISDGRAADSYPIVELLAVAVEAARDEDAHAAGQDEDTPPGHDSEPLGDAALLADLGTSARDLLALCAHEGTLPSDVICEVCERAGCLDELEALRGPA